MSLHFIEKKRTIIGKGGWRKNSYWGNSGSYQKEYKELYDKLVPPQGECDTIHGELVRCIGKLQYDYGNNGWCNTRDVKYKWNECYVCDGNGGFYDEEDNYEGCYNCDGELGLYTEVIEDVQIDRFYDLMLGFLKNHMKNKEVVENLEELMLKKVNYYGDDDEEKTNMVFQHFNDLCDEVMYQVLTTKNKPKTFKYMKELV